jgi:hypothetical protein
VVSYPLRGLLLRAGSRLYKYCWATAPYLYFIFLYWLVFVSDVYLCLVQLFCTLSVSYNCFICRFVKLFATLLVLNFVRFVALRCFLDYRFVCIVIKGVLKFSSNAYWDCSFGSRRVFDECFMVAEK